MLLYCPFIRKCAIGNGCAGGLLFLIWEPGTAKAGWGRRATSYCPGPTGAPGPPHWAVSLQIQGALPRVEQKQPGRFPLAAWSSEWSLSSFYLEKKTFFQPRKFGNGATSGGKHGLLEVCPGCFLLAQGPRSSEGQVLSRIYLGMLFSSPCTFGVKAITKGKSESLCWGGGIPDQGDITCYFLGW